MISKISKKILKLLLPNDVQEGVKILLDKYSTKSYSQEGEDLILHRIFEQKRIGFYVDVGSHHPFRFSNTYIFYKRGWKGINIEPNPISIKLFNKYRPRDINLQIAVGMGGVQKYYLFNEPALNTFDENLAKSRDGVGGYKIVDVKEIKVKPLKEILDIYLPKGQVIDFMNIDCEGLDYEVLQTNDWEIYRPILLLVEIIPANTIEELFGNPIYKYLKEKGYFLFAKCYNTCIFVENSWLDRLKTGGLG